MLLAGNKIDAYSVRAGGGAVKSGLMLSPTAQRPRWWGPRLGMDVAPESDAVIPGDRHLAVCFNVDPLEEDATDDHRHSCGDAEIRSALRAYLLARYAGEADTALIEELGLCRGQVRIDLAVVNGLLHGFEIKSDRDSLRRLPPQAEVYSRVFERMTLVVGNRHLTEAMEVVPDWWGILRIDQRRAGLAFRVVRRGRRNPARDPRALVELLWRDEALSLLAAREAARGVRSKPRSFVWDRICEHFGLDEIAAKVCHALKSRTAIRALGQPS